MDIEVIVVALVGIVGTLGGVYLGNYLERQTQRKERSRIRRIENFKRITDYVEGTLKYISSASYILKYGSDAERNKLFKQYVDQAMSFVSVTNTVIEDDKQLSELVAAFCTGLEGISKVILNESPLITEKEQYLYAIAGKIHKRIEVLLRLMD